MLVELKRYAEVAFENSRLVDAVIRNAIPATHLEPGAVPDKKGGGLNETQQRAIELALAVS